MYPSNHSVAKAIDVLSKNSRKLVVAVLVLLLAVQSVASAAVVDSMMMDETELVTLSIDEGKASCHNKQEQPHHNTFANDDAATKVVNGPSSGCCEIDCHCSSGNCAPAAMTTKTFKNNPLIASTTQNQYDFQWFIGQPQPSLYRPPIHS